MSPLPVTRLCEQPGGPAILLIYNLFAIPALSIVLMCRLARGKSREGWSERWGRLPEDLACKTRTRIWFHAASVGEVMAAQPILKAYRERRRADELFMTVITPGGHEVASSMVGTLVDHVFYAPFDVPWAVKRAARRIQPDVFAGLETELWPNLLHAVRRSGARVALLNGRISDRSLPRYMRLKIVFRWVLSHFDRILAQTSQDAGRLEAIGADSDRIEVLGNAKFDQLTERLSPERIAELRTEVRLPDGAPVLVIGSTRTVEEERRVFAACAEVRHTIPNLAIVHAPRHTDRAAEVVDVMRGLGFEPVRRTEINSTVGSVTELILDTFGELASFYALADVAFVGNSLTPPGGGQNLLQPLAQGKPVIYGPYMQNFRDLCALAEEAGVGFSVNSETEMAQTLARLLNDVARRGEIAVNAVALIEANRGAAERYADVLVDLVEGQAARGHA